MGKKEKSALNVAKFIKSQTLILLDKLNELDDAEALHKVLTNKWALEREN